MEGLTVTAAVGDPVLGMARMTDMQLRLGATGEGDGVNLKLSDEHYQQVVDIMNSDKMVFIDLRDVPATEYSFSHGAWYESSWVSTDVMVTLLGGLSAVSGALKPKILSFIGVEVSQLFRNAVNCGAPATHLLVSTISSRQSAIKAPRISSERPRWYTLAQSKKLIPSSRQR